MTAPWAARASRFDRVGWWNVTRQTVTNMRGYLAFWRSDMPVPSAVPAPMSGASITVPGRVLAFEMLTGEL